MEKNFVKVKWIKAHPNYAYSAGQTGSVRAEKAAQLVKEGYVIPVPNAEDKKVNTLPEDLPERDKLFDLGFTTLEEIKAAGDTLLDEGISKTMLGKIMKYIE